MKRILYIDLSPSPGGSVVSLYHLISHLDRTRYEPRVVLSTLNDFKRLDALQPAVPVRRVPTPQFERKTAGMVERVRAGKVGAEMRSRRAAPLWHALGDLRRLRRDILPVVPPLMRIMREFRPDLVHMNTSIPLLRHAALASSLLRIPAIHHGRSFLQATPLDVRLLLPNARGLIFISQAVADAQLAVMPHPPRYEVIPNAVPVADYAVTVDAAAVRRSLGASPTGPLLGMVGRITPWKGQHIFVEALALLRRQFPDVQGVLVGPAEEADGPGYADRVKQQAQSLGLSDCLHFSGYRDDIPEVLAALDVVVHASVKPEPFGRVIIEGMAAGKPVVGSRAGGALEIISDGVDGLLTPPDDPVALAGALSRLLVDPELSARLGNAARRTARDRFDVAAHVAAVQNFYEQVMRNS